MGWKPKNMGTEVMEVRRVRNFGLDIDLITNYIEEAARSEEMGELSRVLDHMTDDQITLYTEENEIFPATQEGIIWWYDEHDEETRRVMSFRLDIDLITNYIVEAARSEEMGGSLEGELSHALDRMTADQITLYTEENEIFP